MSLNSRWAHRWRSLRVRADLPNIFLVLVVLGIIVFALVDAIQRGYLSSNTLIFLICFAPAVIIHEVSHGVVANMFGDDTAKRAGRLTLNPLKHIDPVGSIVVPIIMVIVAGFPFGWAKPVPVSVNRLRHPRNDAVLVGLAGPFSNVVLAAIAGVVIHYLWTSNHVFTPTGDWTVGAKFAIFFGLANVILAVFNMIPIPPLDGSSLIERLIPQQYIAQYYQMRMFFMVIVLIVVFTQQRSLNNALDHVENWYLNLFT
ncbi:MAG TPA: site-2 protease family protein [Acidimicrobiales bacterium]|jgi:Zn-dependent protease|nr:site-2 protease family protein [Acidimicrobiales bacterium]